MSNLAELFAENSFFIKKIIRVLTKYPFPLETVLFGLYIYFSTKFTKIDFTKKIEKLTRLSVYVYRKILDYLTICEN